MSLHQYPNKGGFRHILHSKYAYTHGSREGPRWHYGWSSSTTSRTMTVDGHATQNRDNAVVTSEEIEMRMQSARPPCYKEVWRAPDCSRLIKDKRAFVEQHRVRGYEVGPDQRSTMITIANLLQEVASNHAVAMWGRSAEGFATDPALAESGLIFVMTRLQIQMDKYPKWGDVVEVETWFQESGKLGAQRDWIIKDGISGIPLGRATSTWVMINMRTRRLSKMPDEIRKRCAWYQLDPPANAIDSAYTRLKIPELDIKTAMKGPMQIARRSDMDMNGHINNVTYLAWAVETVPLDVYTDAHLYQIEVDFKAECHSGDMLCCFADRTTTPSELSSNGAGPNGMTFVHAIQRCEGKCCRELVRARTTWCIGENNNAKLT